MNSNQNKTSLPFEIKDREFIGDVDYQYSNNYVNIGRIILKKLMNKSESIGQIDAATGKVNTFREMRDRSIMCALWLKKMNVKSGDIVTVCTTNQLDAYVPYLAALYIGAIINPWPKREKAIKSTAEYLLTRVKPKVIFVDYDNARKIQNAIIMRSMRRRNILTKIVTFNNDSDEFESLELILKNNECNATDIDTFRCVSKNVKDTAIILLSCSTTGFAQDIELPYIIFLASFNRQTPNMHPGDVGLWFESLHWIISLLLTVRAIFMNVKVVKSSGFNDEHQLCQMIRKYKVTWVFLETSMCNQLSKFDIFETYNISSLKKIIFGGSTIKRSVHMNLIQSLPNVSIIQMYCLPEIGIVAYQRHTGQSGCSGQISENVNLKIVDFETKEPVGPNTNGVIWCKSHSMMNGYYKNPRSTRSVIDDNGWFHTEDVGYYDEVGNIFVIDRVNRLIKYRHHYISPIEIEIELQKHPVVSEVIVLPMLHDHDNFRPLAFVVLVSGRKGKKLAKQKKELLEFIDKTFVGWKQIKHIRFVKQLPHTPDGMVDRKCMLRVVTEETDPNLPTWYSKSKSKSK